MKPRIVLAIVLWTPFIWAQKIDPYAESPRWYKPGHPLEPAAPASIQTLKGFQVEKVVGIPSEVGSISAMTTDPKGNLIVAMQHKPGIYRIDVPASGGNGQATLEPLAGAAASIGWSQGLLWAFDSLYVTVAEKNDTYKPGLYRLLDTDSDGVFDETKTLFEFRGAGEHGPHGLVPGPDGESLYMICGNGTPVPEGIAQRRLRATDGFDHLMPPGFGNSEFTDAGWVFQFQPDGSNPELIAGGLRNSYDLAFNRAGELFTFDSDMEADLGAPWYRPTRICHIVSGAEFGWRASSAKWAEWYEDSVSPVVNIGPASPTGVLFGYKTSFPQKYRDALYVLDWTYATIYAIHLSPDGASYAGEVERFASGIGLPLTDVATGADGALYVSVGGRRLGSAVYRISYAGGFSEAAKIAIQPESDSRSLRRQLESYHGIVDTAVVGSVWAHLGNSDKSIRYAARVALEWQPVDTWSGKAFEASQLDTRLSAFIALARQGDDSELRRLVSAMGELNWNRLDEDRLLRALRVTEIALARGGSDLRDVAADSLKSLSAQLPGASSRANRELARIACYLGDTSAIEPLLDLMEADAGEISFGGLDLVNLNLKYAEPLLKMAETPPLIDRLHYAQMLNWIEEGWTDESRRRYFRLVVDAMQTSQGGVGYRSFWQNILNTAKLGLPEADLGRFADLWAPVENVAPAPEPEGPGRIWELDYLVDRVGRGFGERDFSNGEKMYAAASCLACHGMSGEGGLAGPDLTSIGQRFTIRDLLDSIVNPSRAIADQYQMTILTLASGETVTGRVVSKDARKVTLIPNAANPSNTRSIANTEIADMFPLPASTMPPGLLNTLNEDEVMDLLAYLVAGGQSNHAVYSGDSN